MEAALEDLTAYQWLAFTSPAGVDAFWQCLRGLGRDARRLGPLRLAAVGPATARALSGHGLEADLVPERCDGAHLGEALAAAGGRVLLLRAEEGAPGIAEALARHGAAFDGIPVYRTVCNTARSQELRRELEEGRFDFIAFTSASTVRGLMAALGPDADFSRTLGLCIGEQTAGEARRHGIPVRVAERASMDALTELAINLTNGGI
jgi:uroporphyrinogen III methyltransferase/synthase